MLQLGFLGSPVVKPNAGATGLFPDWGAEIPYASWSKEQNIKKQKQKEKTQNQYCNKLKILKMFTLKKPCN